MNVLNEQFQLVSTAVYANQILSEGIGESIVTEQQAQNALAELYLQNYDLQNKKIISANNKAVFPILNIEDVKENLWETVKERYCETVKSEGTVGKIVQLVLDAIAAIIPLGLFIKALIKIIVGFFIQRGIDSVCRVK